VIGQTISHYRIAEKRGHALGCARFSGSIAHVMAF
jgi:hypothetical protein